MNSPNVCSWCGGVNTHKPDCKDKPKPKPKNDYNSVEAKKRRDLVELD